ncbi:F0F1 ATP synthase subunit delta [Candidatus Uhrbacteria bacterium]|nr:F0F1 ATP synthase subunit delta [Candidatus Uhrbacteria bacterium]
MKVTPRMYAESLLAYTADAKREDVEKVVANLVSYYSRRGKLRILDLIGKELVASLKARDGMYPVDIQSAHPLQDIDRREMEELLSRFRKGQPEITVTVDPALIAGTVITVGDMMIDASLSSRINQLKNVLIPNS